MTSQRLSKQQIQRRAMALREAGRIYDLGDPEEEKNFNGSIDRFCDIIFKLQNAKRVLDIGTGSGLLVALLNEFGHECHAVDFVEVNPVTIQAFKERDIQFKQCNAEVDNLPFSDNWFDAVTCCQVLEHFTHSHLHLLEEVYRVLKPGGLVEVDVPNAVCFRNRSRIIRGKNITWDYKDHYIYAKPIQYKGYSFFPDRHNREFTKNELNILLKEAGFKNIRSKHIKSVRVFTGWRKMLLIGAHFRDIVPSFRKSIMAFAEK
jgi:ubiquinone/menaquinone biosynthesis C-methylase UbiE